MPLPNPVLPTLTEPIFQITEAHSCGDAGWSESYYVRIQAGTRPAADAAAAHQDILDARRVAAPQGHVIESMRVSDVSVAGDSLLNFPPAFGLGAGARVGELAHPSFGYFLTTSDLSATITETRIYRGWATDQVEWSSGAPRATVAPAAVRAFFQILSERLRNARTQGGVNSQYFTKSFIRPGTPVVGPTLRDIESVSINDEGYLQFEGLGDIPDDWVTARAYHVHTPRVKCIRGVSGIHRMISVSAAGGSWKIVTTSRYDCNPELLLQLRGKIFAHLPAYFSIFSVNYGGAGKRDTGRPFYLTRGRSPAR